MTTTFPASDAERMDRHYRFQRHIYDATRTHYLIGRRHLLAELRPPQGGSVLEIGCGTAWNLLRAAKLYPEAQLYGLDVSSAMLEVARASARRRGVSSQLTLQQGDATSFSAADLFGRDTFDRVFFSYALTMIPAWKEALGEALACIAPGGELHIVDFGQCEDLPSSFKRLLDAFLAHYTVYPRVDMESTLRQTAAANGLSARIERLHRGYTIYAVLRRP